MNPITQIQQGMLSQMQQLATVAEGQPIREAVNPAGARPEGINTSFQAVIRAIDDQQHRADAATAAVSRGESDDLVGAMVESQRASISFLALLEVRNKVSSAFDDLMRMPV